MTEQLILEKLDTIEKQSNKLESKVDKIEIAVGLIAVQSERIDNMQKQIHMLWVKHDESFGPNGTINIIKQFQASCPRDYLRASLSLQWKVIGLLATAVTGCLFKAFGLV